MKKAALTLVTLVFGLTMTFADNTGIEKRTNHSEEALKFSLEKVVKTPKFEITSNCEVYVFIEIAKNGKLTVLQIESCNEKLANWIKKELNDIYITGTNIERNKRYFLEFDYMKD